MYIVGKLQPSAFRIYSLKVIWRSSEGHWPSDDLQCPFLQLAMFNFDQYYGDAVNKIQDKLIAFNEKGSGWVLKNVHNISINIAVYEPTLGNTKEDEEDMLNDDLDMI